MTIKHLYPTTRPTLNLDFAKTKQLDPRITFSRASTGTYEDANGVIQSAASNVARFDHDPATGESLGLLIEEARTNLALYSGDFSNAAWAEVGTTKTANALAAPDGTTTAALVVPTAASATHKLRQNVSTTDSALTFSVYLKAAGYTRIALNEQAQIGSSSAIINLADGSGATSGTTVSNAGNGWYRVSWSSTFGSGSPKAFCVVVLPTGGSGENPNNFTWTADGTSGIYIWGAQVEVGAFPTSHIPTTAATVTRAADVASITGTNFSSWYNQSKGSIVCNYRSNKNSSNVFGAFAISDNSPNNRIVHAGNVSGFSVQGFSIVSGIEQASPSTGSTGAQGSAFKFAFGYKQDDFVAAGNGAFNTDASGLVPTVSRIDFGFYYPGSPNSNTLNGAISRLTYWPTRLTNAQLQTLTR
jgi:hypothetical protein